MEVNECLVFPYEDQFKDTESKTGNRDITSNFTRALVAQGCNCRINPDAIASFIKAKRPELFMVLIGHGFNSQT